LAIRLLDKVLFQLMKPYLLSRQPVYAGTIDHALVLCGIRQREGTETFFVHDDQYGPYLALGSLTAASKTDLRIQAHDGLSFPAISSKPVPEHIRTFEKENQQVTFASFPGDRSADFAERVKPFTRRDLDRQVQVLITAGAPRLVLPADEAELDCMNLLFSAAAEASRNAVGGQEHSDSSDEEIESDDEIPIAWVPRTSIMMGIDYKQQRRDHLIKSDEEAARFFAGMHLSEWVVVVEDGSEGEAVGTSTWEVVYDGTSGEAQPRVLMARFGDVLIGIQPFAQKPAVGASLATRLPWLRVPSKIGKA